MSYKYLEGKRMSKKWIELFKGLSEEAIVFDGTGYIVNAGFDTSSNYTKLEIIAFKNIKNFIPSDSGVTFQSDGFKIFIVFEPKSYQYKFQEPYLRSGKAHIPMRWSEIEIITLPTKDRVFVTKQPFMSFGSFTVEKPSSGDFVYYFYENPEIMENLDNFITTILHKDLRIPKTSIPEILGHLRRNMEAFKNSQ